jgi:hypothetical protein
VRIAFIGDVHGCVLHALGSMVLLQERRGVRLNAVIQVGDLGAYPSFDRFDEPSRRFIADSPAQGDFFRLLDPSAELRDTVAHALDLVPPMLFLSGNHEDHEWLAALHGAAEGADIVPVDPLGAIRHVACGHVAEIAGLRVAFLGMIDAPGKLHFDEEAYARFLAAEPGSVDVLVTHEGPYGMSHNALGEVQGSAKLTRLIEHLQPRVHIGGHYHHENGPRQYGRTVSYTLAQLVGPKTSRWKPEGNPTQQVTAGSIGLLDPGTLAFEYVHDDWLAEVCGDDLDLAGITAGAGRRRLR